MLAVVQRVVRASVSVAGEIKGKIGPGLVILLGIKVSDTVADAHYVADKCMHLRIFEDDQGKLNRSNLEIDGAYLVVSQFTLYGDTRHGRRPSFIEAAQPAQAEPLYQEFVDYLRRQGRNVATGVFGAMMQVGIINDGPVTLIVPSKGEALV
ncbi:D-aminoacyl-tRNA deacylase [candidate division KSB1 bacterium]|nr:D-aminoacyl-tRNA deacylase [candidate division KSB1 bacterium]